MVILMRPWALGLATAVVALTACKKQDAATDEAPPSAEASPEPGDEAKADETRVSPPAPAAKADATAPSKPGEGLAAKVDAAMKGHAAGDIKGLEMIPDAAVVVAGVDVATLVKQPAWARLRTRLPRREAGFMEAGSKCGVGTETWVSFVIGTEPTSRNMSMVATAKGLGKEKTLRCLAGALGFDLEPDAKTMSDHTGGGLVLDDDSIAFATTDWMPRLTDLAAGTGAKATDGSLKEVLARTDQKKTLWFAGNVPLQAQMMARMALETSVHDVAGWADFAEGLKVRLSLRVDDAKKARERLQAQWRSAKYLVTSSGVPQGVADSVEFSDADALVTAELSATEDEVRTIIDTVMTTMGI